VSAVVAVDHGSRKTGLAACDATRVAIGPLAVERTDGAAPELVERVASEVAERDARTVLVGLPIRSDGREGDRGPAIRSFAREVATRCPAVRVLLVDEALTSKAADERMRDAGVPRDRRGDWRDSYAALVLLEDWLSDGGSRGEPVDRAPRPP
jgi:putative Holliday junction resolvase